MKPSKVIKEIDSLILQIEGVVTPLKAAATQLQSAQAHVEKDKTLDKTLAAVKEAHLLIHQALNAS